MKRNDAYLPRKYIFQAIYKYVENNNLIIEKDKEEKKQILSTETSIIDEIDYLSITWLIKKVEYLYIIKDTYRFETEDTGTEEFEVEVFITSESGKPLLRSYFRRAFGIYFYEIVSGPSYFFDLDTFDEDINDPLIKYIFSESKLIMDGDLPRSHLLNKIPPLY